MMILVMFSPKLGELEIKEEAIRMHRKQEELEITNSIETYPPQETKDPVRITLIVLLFLNPSPVFCQQNLYIVFVNKTC